MVRFAGNEFSHASVPLVFEGRHFIIEPTDDIPLVSVAVQGQDGVAWEVMRNEPGEGPDVTVSKTGNAVAVSRHGGEFLYKVRPGSETSVAFGRLGGAQDELAVKLKDNFLEIVRLKADGPEEVVMHLENNMFSGPMAGVVIQPDGGIVLGAPIPDWLLSNP